MSEQLSTPPICKIQGCGARIYARGMCNKHYQLDRLHRLKEIQGPTQSQSQSISTGITAQQISPRQTGCLVPGCEKPIMAKGLCSTHYQKSRNDPSFNSADPVKEKSRVCSVLCCGLSVTAKGLCKKHYQRQFYGKPLLIPEEEAEIERMSDIRTAHPEDPGYERRFIDPDAEEEVPQTLAQIKKDNPDLDLEIFLGEPGEAVPQWIKEFGLEAKLGLNRSESESNSVLAPNAQQHDGGQHDLSPEFDGDPNSTPKTRPIDGWTLEDEGESEDAHVVWVPET